MKIKIVVGTYGYRPDGSNAVLLKDNKSEPFEVEDTEAERIIALGIAEKAMTIKEEINSEIEKELLEEGAENVELEQCDINELRRIAGSMGLPTNGKKVEIIARIKEAEETAEEPPMLEAAEPEV